MVSKKKTSLKTAEPAETLPSVHLRLDLRNPEEILRHFYISKRGSEIILNVLTRIMHDDATIVLIWATNRLKTAKEFHSNDGIQLQTAFQAGYGSFYRSQ